MLPRDILARIHVNLQELYLSGLGLLLGQRMEDGSNGLARTAPVGVEVYNVVCGCGERSTEVRRRVDVDRFVRHGGGW